MTAGAGKAKSLERWQRYLKRYGDEGPAKRRQGGSGDKYTEEEATLRKPVTLEGTHWFSWEHWRKAHTC